MNHKLNASDIINQQDLQNRKRIRIYKKVLDKCYNRIKFTAKKNTKWCFYTVPNYMVGVPLYDVNACIIYMIKQLHSGGFLIKYTHPNLLFISWKHYIPAYQRLEIKKKYGVKIDGFGNLVQEKKAEEKPKHLISATSTTPGANKKIFKPVNTYKPTGNLIYGQDLIKRINAKTTK